MNKDIQIFENPEFGKVRIQMNTSNEPLFCLADVAKALDIKNARDLKTRLNEKGVVTTDTPTKGGIQQIIFINEANLYRCIFQSRRPDAEKFQDWVCEEVLPSIRKNGGYMVAKDNDTPEEIMARALLLADETIKRKNDRIKQLEENNQRQQEQIKSNAPKVLFADAVVAADSSILIGKLANVLKQNGIEMGQNRLFKWMRENGYLCKNGEKYNQPTQKAMELELFEVSYNTVVRADKSFQTITTKVTGKGQLYFVNKFLGKNDNKINNNN